MKDTPETERLPKHADYANRRTIALEVAAYTAAKIQGLVKS